MPTPIVTITALSANTGLNFTAGQYETVNDLLENTPDISISIEALTGITGQNLTSMGVIPTGTFWRLRNGTGSTASATFSGYNTSFSRQVTLVANTDTYISSPIATLPATHILDITGGRRITKAASPNTTTVQVATSGQRYYVTGSSFDDTLIGAELEDTLIGGDGKDTLKGNEGNDSLDGGAGNDRLIGGGGNDSLIGNAGNDSLDGSAGDDSLFGGDGNDTLIGNAGIDSLTGGNGADRFAYTNSNHGNDTIADFNITDGDLLQFTGTAFGGLPTGTLAANQLAAAEDNVARFIYNSGTGLLQYDPSLTTTGGLLTIATLTGAPAITNAQIVIV